MSWWGCGMPSTRTAICRPPPQCCRTALPRAVEANSLVSSETEIPVGYYRMPFCRPEEGIKKASSTINPGTILLGIRILNSPYVFSVMVWW